MSVSGTPVDRRSSTADGSPGSEQGIELVLVIATPTLTLPSRPGGYPRSRATGHDRTPRRSRQAGWASVSASRAEWASWPAGARSRSPNRSRPGCPRACPGRSPRSVQASRDRPWGLVVAAGVVACIHEDQSDEAVSTSKFVEWEVGRPADQVIAEERAPTSSAVCDGCLMWRESLPLPGKQDSQAFRLSDLATAG